jgi:hypothetical protein
VEADTRLRASVWEFGRRILHRGYVVFIGIMGGLLGTFNEFFGGAIKLPPWASWALFGSSLLIAAIWAFHDLRVESLKRAAELKGSSSPSLDDRYSALGDLLGRSLAVGVALSQEREWVPLNAWEAHTRRLIADAYGEGVAVPVFTPELKGSKVLRGKDAVFAMMERPPPLAETINNVKALLERTNSMEIRSGFDPSPWQAFDPVAYKAEHALEIRTIGDDDQRSCPWCGLGIDERTTQCGGCNADFEGDLAYRTAAPEIQSAFFNP